MDEFIKHLTKKVDSSKKYDYVVTKMAVENHGQPYKKTDETKNSNKNIYFMAVKHHGQPYKNSNRKIDAYNESIIMTNKQPYEETDMAVEYEETDMAVEHHGQPYKLDPTKVHPYLFSSNYSEINK
uniref:Uncharacterized protein n=1 Tax=viral metagenome TaxID=1070528 RepID=A0A6C0H522_9ZZZZ